MATVLANPPIAGPTKSGGLQVRKCRRFHHMSDSALSGHACGSRLLSRTPFVGVTDLSARADVRCTRPGQLVGFGCAAREAPRMNSFSPPSPRICGGSQRCSPDHRHIRLSASSRARAKRQGPVQRSPLPTERLNRLIASKRLLQQNRTQSGRCCEATPVGNLGVRRFLN